MVSLLEFQKKKVLKVSDLSRFRSNAILRKVNRNYFEGLTVAYNSFGHIPDKHSTFDYLEDQEGLFKLQEKFLEWVKVPIFLCYSTEDNKGNNIFKWDLGSKRGNSIYATKLKTVVSEFEKEISGSKLDHFFNHNNKRIKQETPMIFCTLTPDPKKYSRAEAWYILAKEFNKFRSRITSRFKCKVSIIRSFEGYEKDKNSKAYGYPHIHLLMLFDKVKMPVRWHIKSNSWRLEYSTLLKFKKSWKMGYSDFIGVACLSQEAKEKYDNNSSASVQSVGHILKYMMKSFSSKKCKPGSKGVLINSILWGLSMRSFSLSGRFTNLFKKVLSRLDIESNGYNSNSLIDSDGRVYVFKGVFSECCMLASVVNGGKPPDDCIKVNKEITCLSELDDPEKHSCLKVVEKYGIANLRRLAVEKNFIKEVFEK